MCTIFICDENCPNCTNMQLKMDNGYRFENRADEEIVICPEAFEKATGELLFLRKTDNGNYIMPLKRRLKQLCQLLTKANQRKIENFIDLADSLRLDINLVEICEVPVEVILFDKQKGFSFADKRIVTSV